MKEISYNKKEEHSISCVNVSPIDLDLTLYQC